MNKQIIDNGQFDAALSDLVGAFNLVSEISRQNPRKDTGAKVAAALIESSFNVFSNYGNEAAVAKLREKMDKVRYIP
jgi:hypothetical protein